MMVDAVLPAASELVMVYGGAVASGAFAGQSVVLFGWEFESGFPAYFAIAVAGTVGYTVGSIGGWWIGLHGGRPFLERHGRWLHLKEANLAQGRALVRTLGGLGRLPRPDHPRRALVRLDPGRRVSRALSPLHRPDAARLRDLVLRPRGGRLGARKPWEEFHHDFHYVDYVIIASIVAGIAFVAWKLYRRRGAAAGAR